MKTPPIIFILPAQPAPKDASKYNAFGFRKDFGKAYSAYYAKKDKAKITSDTPPPV